MMFYCIAFFAMFVVNIFYYISEWKKHRDRKTPMGLFLSSNFGFLLLIILVLFNFIGTLAFSQGTKWIGNTTQINSSVRHLYFAIYTMFQFFPFLLLTSWRYIEVTILELLSVPAHELMSLNQKYGAQMQRLERLPRVIYFGHLVTWVIVIVLFIAGIANWALHSDIAVVESSGIWLFARTEEPSWVIVPVILTYVFVFAQGIFLGIFSIVKMRDAETAVPWHFYFRLGALVAFGSGVGIILKSVPTQYDLWLAAGSDLITFACFTQCEIFLKKIRDVIPRHNSRDGRTSDIFDGTIE